MSKSESLGCARCGSCCDPVQLGPAAVAALEDPEYTTDGETKAFAAEHWRQRGERDEEGWVFYDCDQFDPDTRLCRAGENRPPVCKGFPWYSNGPTRDRARSLPPWCSYLLDVSPVDRPFGPRPFIPVEVIQR